MNWNNISILSRVTEAQIVVTYNLLNFYDKSFRLLLKRPPSENRIIFRIVRYFWQQCFQGLLMVHFLPLVGQNFSFPVQFYRNSTTTLNKKDAFSTAKTHHSDHVHYHLFGKLAYHQSIYRVVQKTVPQFYFCDNFRKCTPILTIFSLLEPEIYDA